FVSFPSKTERRDGDIDGLTGHHRDVERTFASIGRSDDDMMGTGNKILDELPAFVGGGKSGGRTVNQDLEPWTDAHEQAAARPAGRGHGEKNRRHQRSHRWRYDTSARRMHRPVGSYV